MGFLLAATALVVFAAIAAPDFFEAGEAGCCGAPVVGCGDAVEVAGGEVGCGARVLESAGLLDWHPVSTLDASTRNASVPEMRIELLCLLCEIVAAK